MKETIGFLIMEYFYKHPKQDLKHGPVVDWVTEQYLKDHTEPPRDVWRNIRALYQQGILIKVKKGVYRYDPDLVSERELFDFDEATKQKIKERDNFQCVVCARGLKEGVEIVVDHIKAKNEGGTNDIDNGQTLCMQHNLMKNMYSQTEAGKRYFIRMYKIAVKNKDMRIINFCRDIFNVYDKHKINGHIARPNGK